MDGEVNTSATHNTHQPPQPYITNPFSIALAGINALKDHANSIFILSLVLGLIDTFGGGYNFNFRGNPFNTQGAPPTGSASTGPEFWVPFLTIIALVLLAFAVIGFIVWGMFSYVSAKLAKGEGATMGEAFNAVIANFWRLLLVVIIMIFRLLGWYLLLIIPGFVMQYRYSLSGLIAFAEPELKPSQVVSRSAELTKDAWFDTYGAMTSFGLITFGVMQPMTEIGASSVLYRQLRALKESGGTKPQTHIISYLLLIIPIVLVILFGVLFLLLIAALSGSL